MRLLMSPASPFVRKARVVIRETGLPVEEVAVTTTPLAPDATLAAANPMRKIPTLLRPDGPALYDSRVICRFLDAQAEAGLYPESRLWEVLTLEALGDAISDAAVAISYETRLRDAAQQSPAWIEAQWAKIEAGLGALEAQWMPLLAGPLNAGQIAVGAALGYLDLRHDARAWRTGHGALDAWAQGFATRPSMQDTLPQ